MSTRSLILLESPLAFFLPIAFFAFSIREYTWQFLLKLLRVFTFPATSCHGHFPYVCTFSFILVLLLGYLSGYPLGIPFLLNAKSHLQQKFVKLMFEVVVSGIAILHEFRKQNPQIQFCRFSPTHRFLKDCHSVGEIFTLFLAVFFHILYQLHFHSR